MVITAMPIFVLQRHVLLGTKQGPQIPSMWIRYKEDKVSLNVSDKCLSLEPVTRKGDNYV